MTDRSFRLQSRFDALKAGLEHVLGRDKAFAVAAVAELECIQYAILQALRRTAKEGWAAEERGDGCDHEVPELHEEIKNLLQSFHRGLCEHLALPQSEVIEESKHFKEIVDDICNKRG